MLTKISEISTSNFMKMFLAFFELQHAERRTNGRTGKHGGRKRRISVTSHSKRAKIRD
jgi:hypothetical protein